MSKQIISYEELTGLVKKLETIPAYGYHRTYQENKLKEAIAAYNRFSLLKYFWFKPRYRQMIKQAQEKITTNIKS